MHQPDSDSKLWDEGCKTCSVRNNFIIPYLSKILDSTNALSILDVGSGTGYVARETDKNLRQRNHWTLVDRDTDRLTYAKNSIPESMIATYRLTDMRELSKEDAQFDRVLVCNSILEFGFHTDFYTEIMKLIRPSGKLIVSMPDTLVDAMQANETNALQKYAQDLLVLDKNDKFTDSNYPFFAHRPITVICGFIAVGLTLEDCIRSGEGGGHYLFVFSRSDTLK